MPIAIARTASIGTVVQVRGVVTAQPGRLGTPPLFAISDASGGIVVRLPSDSGVVPQRGDVIVVRGMLAMPYGQLEIRPRLDGLSNAGSAALPTPLAGSGALGESIEARLVERIAMISTRPAKSTSGDITVLALTSDGTPIRLAADGSSAIEPSSLEVGATYRFVGLVGQRATRKATLDGYRLWLRDSTDVQRRTSPSPSPSPTPTTSPNANPTPTPRVTPSATPRPTSSQPAIQSIASALRTNGHPVTVRGTVTAPATLLDATGRRIVIQDATAAVELLLPKDVTAPAVGSDVRVSGQMSSAYGSARLRVDVLDRSAGTSSPTPLVIRGPLGDGHAWRLVVVTGRVEDVKKLGQRWRAEVTVGAARILVVGQPGSGIEATALTEGRTATITGIVRRAYPSASDRRPSLLPRSAADVHVDGSAGNDTAGSAASGSAGSGSAGAPGTPGGSTAAGGGSGVGLFGTSATAAGGATSAATPHADLSDLAAFEGRVVLVGGLVESTTDVGFRLDDGTAVGTVQLVGQAAPWIALIEPGDAINIEGRVTTAPTGLFVAVDDPARISLGGDLFAGEGASLPPAQDAPQPPPERATAASQAALAGDLGQLPGPGAGLASLLGVGLLSLAVTGIRRRQARRSRAARVGVRLARLVGPAATIAAPVESPAVVGTTAEPNSAAAVGV